METMDLLNEVIEKLETEKRSDLEIMNLDPEELTTDEIVTFAINNVFLLSELTTIVGVGRIHKDLLKLREIYKEEETK